MQTKELINKINELLGKKESVVVAVEGGSASGKTTLGKELEQIFKCTVLHMDDFFLRPEQRTEARYAQPGGNVDYERFLEEVLVPLKAGGAFSYRPFSCKTFSLGEPVKVTHKALNFVEGTYCLHPYFGNPYDLRIFLSIDPMLQRERILQRPSCLQDRFFEAWIPMERRYFDFFQIPQQADLLLDMSRPSQQDCDL